MTSGIWTSTRAAMKKRYVTALITKIQDTDSPTPARIAAATGPITRVPLIIAELRLIAPGRSVRWTSNGIDAWKAGALSALADPIPACTRKIQTRLASCATK